MHFVRWAFYVNDNKTKALAHVCMWKKGFLLLLLLVHILVCDELSFVMFTLCNSSSHTLGAVLLTCVVQWA